MGVQRVPWAVSVLDGPVDGGYRREFPKNKNICGVVHFYLLFYVPIDYTQNEKTFFIWILICV